MRWKLLSSLSDADQARVLAAARPRQFERGEVLVHEGEQGESLHLVRLGRLGVRVSRPSGESLTLNVLSPGDAFGELAALGQAHRRTATVIAFEPAETLTVSGTTFKALCRQHPAVERLVVRLLVERVDQLSQRLIEALYVSVDQRVIRRLTELDRIYGNGSPGTVIPLTQDDLAGLAGATRPTVNQVLQRLDAAGVLAVGRGRLQIRDPAWLQRHAAA